jgi:hypothetical protein
MRMRNWAAGLLAAAVLFGGTAQACDKPEGCSSAASPTADTTHPAQPLRLNAYRKKAQPKRPPVAQAEPAPAKTAQARPAQVKPAEVKPVQAKPADARPVQVKPARVRSARAKPAQVAAHPDQTPILLPQSQPLPDGANGWLASVYAMDPALAAAEALAGSRTETDRVRVTEADELNEIDMQADAVRVVAADELNEVDLTSEPPASTTGQSLTEQPAPAAEARSATSPAPAQTPWMAALVIAFGGAVASASALVLRRSTRSRRVSA